MSEEDLCNALGHLGLSNQGSCPTRMESVIRYLSQKTWSKDDLINMIDAMAEEDPISREQKLKELYVSSNIFDTMYTTFESIVQSSKVNAGRFLEKSIEDYLDKHDISYEKQVGCQNGIIVGTKRKGGVDVIDIVIPKPVVGDTISCYILLSAKTTLRERWKQDLHIPARYKVFVTYEANDYRKAAVGRDVHFVHLKKGEEEAGLDTFLPTLVSLVSNLEYEITKE